MSASNQFKRDVKTMLETTPKEMIDKRVEEIRTKIVAEQKARYARWTKDNCLLYTSPSPRDS